MKSSLKRNSKNSESDSAASGEGRPRATPRKDEGTVKKIREIRNARRREEKTASQARSTIQFLTFLLDGELFAVDISSVREVLDYTRVTRVPRTLPHIKGIINLRGNVVSVTDLRQRLGMPPLPRIEDACVIIVDVGSEGDAFPVGLLADSVQAVTDVPQDQVDAAPKVGIQLKAEYINGIAKIDEDYAIILAVDRIILGTEKE